ncbi:MAG: hypothetical protein LYZ69_03595 [Nitrososphaerales archaeon]|nr:hypothetical protein [Nitrososphaerales archaeon]
MSSRTSQRAEDRPQAACGLCGRMLNHGYYFVCHVCGATYCYAHMPEKCQHRRVRSLAPVGPVSPKA